MVSGDPHWLKANQIKISMHRKRRVLDKIFVEKPWYNIKHECIYLTALNTVTQVVSELTK